MWFLLLKFFDFKLFRFLYGSICTILSSCWTWIFEVNRNISNSVSLARKSKECCWETGSRKIDIDVDQCGSGAGSRFRIEEEAGIIKYIISGQFSNSSVSDQYITFNAWGPIVNETFKSVPFTLGKSPRNSTACARINQSWTTRCLSRLQHLRATYRFHLSIFVIRLRRL